MCHFRECVSESINLSENACGIDDHETGHLSRLGDAGGNHVSYPLTLRLRVKSFTVILQLLPVRF